MNYGKTKRGEVICPSLLCTFGPYLIPKTSARMIIKLTGTPSNQRPIILMTVLLIS
jgi:hypothetical protein